MLRIIDANFNVIGEIRTIKRLQFVHKWYEVSTCTFTVHESVKYVNLLDEDVTIMFFNDETLCFIIADMKYSAKDGTWEFTALSAGSLLLRRVTIPPAGADTDKYTTQAVETIMKSIVSKNAIAATDTDRNIPNLVNAPNTGRGPTLTFETRYKNVAEELYSLSRSSGNVPETWRKSITFW